MFGHCLRHNIATAYDPFTNNLKGKAMMCRRCSGEGYEEYEEDGRTVRDACYHCATTGQVDEELDWHDRLHDVASELAIRYETEYRMWKDNEPDGDGYGLCAAEEGLSEYDYFRARVWIQTDSYAERLAEMPLSMQEVLVAWNEMPPHNMGLLAISAGSRKRATHS